MVGIVNAMYISKELSDGLWCFDHQIHLVVTQSLEGTTEGGGGWAVAISSELLRLHGNNMWG